MRWVNRTIVEVYTRLLSLEQNDESEEMVHDGVPHGYDRPSRKWRGEDEMSWQCSTPTRDTIRQSFFVNNARMEIRSWLNMKF